MAGEMELELITCIVQKGKADEVVEAAMAAGAKGATIFDARGTGVRQKMGVLGASIRPEKEVILIMTSKAETQTVFDAMTAVGRLNELGQGLAFIHKVDRAAGLVTVEAAAGEARLQRAA